MIYKLKWKICYSHTWLFQSYNTISTFLWFIRCCFTGLRTWMFLCCRSQRSFTKVVFLPVYAAISFRWRGTEPASPPSQDTSAVPFPPWLPSFQSGIKPRHDRSTSMTREWLSDHTLLSSFSFSLVTRWGGGFISTSLLQKYLRECVKQK